MRINIEHDGSDLFYSILGIIFLLLFLPIVVIVGSQAIKLFSQAATSPANIKISLNQTTGALPRVWEGLSQGGETDKDGTPMLLNFSNSPIKDLHTKFIRIDHVFDQPSSPRIAEIVNSGATPFISLSYFPSDVADSPIGTVNNWNAWQAKVTAMVSSLSGRTGYNLHNVYYEVWNEPDGAAFGNFNIGSGKDYFTLYSKTVEAALRAQNVNDFKIGGPALADVQRCTSGFLGLCSEYWLDQFLNLATKNQTRLDFVSWHRYSLKTTSFYEDANFIKNLEDKYPSLGSTEKIVSEWGSAPEKSAIHSTNFDAAHLVSATRALVGSANLATKFEARDGPNDSNTGWGMVSYNGQRKPAFVSEQLLGLLRSTEVIIQGEGTYVTGIASRDNSGFTLVLSNYDPKASNTEKVPINISGLVPGTYRINKYTINSISPLGANVSQTLAIPTGGYITDELMLPNSVTLWDFQLKSI